jgi:epoxyqueuosine reductase
MPAARYEAEFTGTAMRRATRSGLRRNAAVVLGNRGDDAALPALITALTDEDAVVRGHAAWAIGCIHAGHPALATALRREADAHVRDEIEQAMAQH